MPNTDDSMLPERTPGELSKPYDEFRSQWSGDFKKYRSERIREVVPDELFPKPTRKSHRMKELLMIQPVGPRVLVKLVDAPKLQSETIIIPDVVEAEASPWAVVLAVGTKVREDIHVADTVVLAKYSGAPVTVDLDGEKLEAIIVMEADVLGVLKD